MTSPVNIAEVIVHGVMFDPKNSAAVKSMDLNALYQAVPQLFDLLDEREIDFSLVGGIAMLVYVAGRNTQDIALIIPSSALAQLPELVVDDSRGEFVRAKLGELQVDLLLTSNKLFDEVRENHTQLQNVADGEVPCATVEGLLLLKMFALPSLYRQGQFDRVELYERDIAMLLRDYQPDLPPLLEKLSNHVLESDFVEINSILLDIQQRIAASKSRFSAAQDEDGGKNRPPETNSE